MKRRDFLIAPVLGAALPAVEDLERLYPWTAAGIAGPGPAGDPAKFQQRLHQDFVTYVPGIEYFMLGNGEIAAMVQYCPDRGGEKPQTFLGMTLFDPERFARKWSTFLFHPEAGLGGTRLTVTIGGKGYVLAPESFSSIRWQYPDGIPTVALKWTAAGCGVEESFSVPASGPTLFRVVRITNSSGAPAEIRLSLSLYPNFALFDEIAPDETTRTARAKGFASMMLQSLDGDATVGDRYRLTVSAGTLAPGETRTVRFVYSIAREPKLMDRAAYDAQRAATVRYWASTSQVATGNDTLDHLYNISRTGLRAMLARSGKRDGGIWMYNMEWVRDDVMVLIGMLQTGMYAEARTLLTKIMEKSIGPDGRTIESSRWFGFDYTELDQNGQVLYGMWAYACWTGDIEFVRSYWEKLALVAEFPLTEIFRDKESGLVHNKREYWERRDEFGVEDGYELAYQFWVALGLDKGAELADLLGKKGEATRWNSVAKAMQDAIVHHPKFSLVEEGHFIKRRTRDGRWQRLMIPPDRNRMPPGSPLATEQKPECEPDSSNVFPVIFGMVDGASDLALGTLRHCEGLWNQRWETGGYSRYNVASEPDPPAPWPIATLFMARAYVEAGNDDKVWQCVNWVRNIHGGLSGGWFERYGPSITPPAPPVSIVGWAWAEVVLLVVHHLLGFRPGLNGLTIQPRLIRGTTMIKATFQVRGNTIAVAAGRSAATPYAIVDGKRVKLSGGALTLGYPAAGSSMNIELFL